MSRINTRVVCAACLDHKTGKIVIGMRHFDDIMRSQMDSTPGPSWAQSEQGFVDQRGSFLTREEALEIAQKEGQIIRRCDGDEKELFSENLY